MFRIRGWGLVLVVCLPLLLYFGWSRLGDERSRVSFERYEQWASGQAAWLPPLEAYFLKHRKLAVAGDVVMPGLPRNSGIKAWSLRADATLLVELDAKVEGRAVQLHYVPVIRSTGSVVYECLSSAASVRVERFCRSERLRSTADMPAQLAENARVLLSMPDIVSASNVDLPAGSSMGSVVVVPSNVAELDHCGFQCVKPQSCVTPRPLACSKLVDGGNGRRFEVAPSNTDYPGSRLATRSAADKACEQALGAGYRVLRASSITGYIKLSGGTEYWVHNDVRPQSNCWETDYR